MTSQWSVVLGGRLVVSPAVIAAVPQGAGCLCRERGRRTDVDAQRNRWLQQLDDATVWLLDNAATYVGSWPSSRIIRFVIDYTGHARRSCSPNERRPPRGNCCSY